MKKLATSFLCFCLLAGLFAGCGNSNAGGNGGGGTAGPVSGEDLYVPYRTDDHLNLHLFSNVAKLDPQYSTSTFEWQVLYQIYDTLVDYNQGDPNSLVPALADEWTISDDGLEYLFHIRQGVSFHNGDPLTVEDVLFTLNRWYTSPVTSGSVYMVDTIEKVDDENVKITLLYPYPPFLSMMANYSVGIVNKAAVEASGDGTEGMVIGTGAYKIQDWRPGESLTLEAVDYWKTEPYFKTVTYKIIADQNTGMMSFESGELDSFSYATNADVLAARNVADYRVTGVRRVTTYYLAMNNQVAPLNDVRVRQAINYAVDKQAAANMIFDGEVFTDMELILSEGTEGYTTDITTYPRDVEAAKALLAEAGFDSSNPLTLHLCYPSNSWGQKYATTMQASLGEVGINLVLDGFEDAAWGERMAQRDFELGFMEMGTVPYNADITFNIIFYSSGYYNVNNYKNDVVDRMIDEARHEMDDAKRVATYEEISRIVRDEAVYAPLFYLKANLISYKELMGAYMEPVNLLAKIYDYYWGSPLDIARATVRNIFLGYNDSQVMYIDWLAFNAEELEITDEEYAEILEIAGLA